MKLPIRLFVLFSVVCGVTTVAAQTTVKGAFINAPFNVLPTLPKDARLDMIDYFEHGLDHPSATYFADEARILKLDSIELKVQASPKVEVSFSVIPEKSDTLFVVIETVETPAKDSKVSVYTTDWKKLYTFDAGFVKDWLNSQGKKVKALPDAENTLSFITAEATVTPGTNQVVFTNTSAERVSDEEYSAISPYILQNRVFTLTRKEAKQAKQ